MIILRSLADPCLLEDTHGVHTLRVQASTIFKCFSVSSKFVHCAHITCISVAELWVRDLMNVVY